MKKNIILVAAILLIVFIHNIFGILNPSNHFLISKLSFINSFFYNKAIHLKDNYNDYKNFKKTAEENAKLKQQIENLTTEIAKLKFLEQENQTLKIQLNFLKAQEFEFISAGVFQQNFDGTSRILMIDKGENDGITKDAPVIAGGGILIGVIENTEKLFSKIRLLSGDDSQISVQIHPVMRQGVPSADGAISAANSQAKPSLGLLKGGFDLGMRIELVPQPDKISSGSSVVTSGLDKNIPGGLLIGYAESVKSNPREPFQTVFIKSAVDYSKITTVSVLTK